MTVRLILISHGRYVAGDNRPITLSSAQECFELGQKLTSNYGVPDVIYSSEIARAKATALLIAQATVYPKDKVTVTSELSESSEETTVAGFIHFIAAEGENCCYQTIVAVTHLPVIEKITGYLTGKQSFTGMGGCLVLETGNWSGFADGNLHVLNVN